MRDGEDESQGRFNPALGLSVSAFLEAPKETAKNLSRRAAKTQRKRSDRKIRDRKIRQTWIGTSFCP
jgi:hypothetical protein